MARRAYSDATVGAILDNINTIVNGNAAAAAQQAQAEQQDAERERAMLQATEIRNRVQGRSDIGQRFATFASPDAIRPNAAQIYGAAIAAGLDPNEIPAAFLGYAGAAGGTNDQLGGLYVGSGHAIRPGDAFTVPRQNEIAANEERIGDERLGSQLSNAFKIASMEEGGRNARFYNPAQISPNLGETTFLLGPDGKTRGTFESSPNAASIFAAAHPGGSGGAGHVALDVSPSDYVGIRDDILGDILKNVSMDDATTQAVVARATQLYQQTRNAPGSVQQALDELTVEQPATGINPFANPSRVLKPQPAPTAAPAPAAAVADPDANIPEGTIQQNKTTGQKRVRRGGQWVIVQ